MKFNWSDLKPVVIQGLKILLMLLAGGVAGHVAGGSAGRTAATAVVSQK